MVIVVVVIVVVVVLLNTLVGNLDTGTRVTFFFLCEADLLFGDALLLTRRNLYRGGDRRELTFSSGLLGKLDLDLLVGLCRFGFNLFLSVCRGKDAKGNGDAGFKIQGDDLCGAKSPLLDNLKDAEKNPLALLSVGERKGRGRDCWVSVLHAEGRGLRMRMWRSGELVG